METIISDRKVSAYHNGTPLRFERRRYGKTTYTWLEWWNGEEWVSAGDPWPSVRIPRADLDAIFGKDAG